MHNADPEGPASSTDCSKLDHRRNTASAQARATHRYRKTDRRQAPKRAVLPEPIEIGKFFANRGGDVVIVSLREFEGALLLDIRKHYADGDGFLRPTKKGIAVAIRRLPDLALAVATALRTARELGLISGATQ